jgi:hypothetical protein
LRIDAILHSGFGKEAFQTIRLAATGLDVGVDHEGRRVIGAIVGAQSWFAAVAGVLPPTEGIENKAILALDA